MTVDLPASASFHGHSTRPEPGVDPFRLVFETARVGIAIGAPGGEILYVNETMCRLLGRPHDEITVRDGSSRPRRIPTTSSGSASGSGRSRRGRIQPSRFRETRFQHPDGTTVKRAVPRERHPQPDGSIAYLVAHAEDITDSRRTGRRSRRARTASGPRAKRASTPS